MAPSRKKGASKAAAAAAARKKWKVGDLVLAKVKGFPAWPATVSEPEKWGYSSDWKKVLVYFFGTNQIAFCNPVDVEAFTEEKKELFLTKRHGRSADFVRAVQEIVDSYEKLKEQSRTDVNSLDAPFENPLAGCSDVPDSAVSSATLNSKLKSSNSTVKGEQNCSVEDVEASMEVDIPHNREECEGITSDTLEPKNSCTMRRGSKSTQSQCSTEIEKKSVKRSRSSFRLKSHRIQNSTVVSNHQSKKAFNATNEILDSSGRRSKRNRRSPYRFVQHVSDSPACNSNGTIDDNGSEVAMADSDTLSNDEISVVESNHKTRLSEAVEACERDLELSERLNLQIETVILRKKRKPARKRVIVDVECNAQPHMSENGFLNVENAPSMCENSNEKHMNDGGDEHLPLVKRARVRMGKHLTEDEQLDLVNNTAENVASEQDTQLDIVNNAAENVAEQVGVLSDSTDNGCCEESLAVKTSSDFLPPFCSSSQVSNDRVRLWKAEKSHLLNCSFDGEAALPPSKRLHRALEAMSANSVEEDQSCAEQHSALKMDSQVCHVTSAERDISTGLDREGEEKIEAENISSYCNGVCASPDDVTGVSTIQNLPKIITKSCEEASVVNNSVRGTVQNVDFQSDRSEEVALFSGSENHSGCDDNGIEKPDLADKGPLEIMADQLPAENDEPVGHNEPHVDFAGDQIKCEFTAGVEEVPKVRSEDDIPVMCCTLGAPATSENAKPPVDEVEVCMNEQNFEPMSVENIQASSPKQGIQEIEVSEPGIALGASPVEQVDIPGGVPVPHSSVPGSADHSVIQRNDYTPDTNLDYEKHASDKHRKLDLEASSRAKASGKSNNLADVKSVLSSLEMMLATLTRTKESIGRATRIAIDCAKFGVAAEVVDIIARNLEKESSLHRKVDLFFLVDSIAQCSRGIKGGIGDKYTSTIQSTLPRFLSAAAPPGYAGRENRRQCMKVLKLWLERRVLSESIICQQLRRLDSLSCSSSTDRPSQRMTRTERSFDDPIREMEGMHVDEYGSNSSFQLPGFCMPRMLKDEDGASDSDSGSFEAVTPEHEPSCPENHEAVSLPVKEKHRHILEDVDGELEMEDVAPCEVETRPPLSTSSGIDDVRSAYSHEQQFLPRFGPPVSHDVPSRAPPLPISPPPPPPPLPPPPSDMPPLPSVSHSVADSHVHVGTHTLPETLYSQPPASAVALPQVTENSGSCSFSSYPIVQPAVRPGHNPHQGDAAACGNSYFRPPHPPASNQFVYFHDQVRRQGEAPPPPPPPAPPYCNRPQFGQAVEGVRFYGDHDRAKSAPYDESWRFSRPFPGAMHHEKGKNYQPSPYPGPSHEYVRTNHDRPFPPPPMHHRNHAPSSYFTERSAPIAVRAPGYWPPR